MQEKPKFERPDIKVIGPISEEKKNEYKKNISDNFGEKHYEQLSENQRKILESHEYKKEPYEKLVIQKSNEIINILVKDSGMTNFDISEQNIHIIPGSLYKEIKNDDSLGNAHQEKQFIIINADLLKDPLERSSTIFHEIVHLKNFLAIDAQENSNKPRRKGLVVEPSFKTTEKTGHFNYFSGLNEAVVSEIKKIYFFDLIRSNPFLEKEYTWNSSKEAEHIKRKKAEELGIDSSEIISVDEKNSFKRFAYLDQRKVLYYVVEKIFTDNKEQFQSKDEIFKIFFNAHFNGNLLEISRLFEKSFGEGSFRILGMMTSDTKSCRLVMNYLSKHEK